ncbi:MAG: NUDIX hydrolase [Caldilineaceae bacterium]
MEDELMDVVDQSDQVVGQKRRSELYAENSSNCRAINAFLVNSQGQLWIPRRTAQKRLFPLHLDMSCGGHVHSGESYEEALQRELQEELNLDLRQVAWSLLGHLSSYRDGVSMFMKVYEIHSDTTPSWNPADFIEAAWFEVEELQNQIHSGEPVKGDLPLLLEKFYG